jgi:energy-coupling factor transport system ATP-binding protein
LAGRILVDGLDTREHAPRDMASVVGFVFQDPEAQFVTERVEDELAFALENAGAPPLTMRKRVEEVLDALGIAALRNRAVSSLSGGEQQRVAIAAALALQPKILVLDEPTSQLDPQSAEDVLSALVRLNADLGLTIVLAEHRLERVLQFADRVVFLPGAGELPFIGDPREVMESVALTPPLVTLGKALGWKPLPLTIKEGRRFASLHLSPQRITHPTARQNARSKLQAAAALEVRDVWHADAGAPRRRRSVRGRCQDGGHEHRRPPAPLPESVRRPQGARAAKRLPVDRGIPGGPALRFRA